jgi:hypothetical protein
MSTIRKITVGKEIQNSVSYVVGGKPPFASVSEMKDFKITQIIEKDGFYLMFVSNEKNESHLWKKLPVNDSTSVEYKIEE